MWCSLVRVLRWVVEPTARLLATTFCCNYLNRNTTFCLIYLATTLCFFCFVAAEDPGAERKCAFCVKRHSLLLLERNHPAAPVEDVVRFDESNSFRDRSPKAARCPPQIVHLLRCRRTKREKKKKKNSRGCHAYSPVFSAPPFLPLMQSFSAASRISDEQRCER